MFSITTSTSDCRRIWHPYRCLSFVKPKVPSNIRIIFHKVLALKPSCNFLPNQNLPLKRSIKHSQRCTTVARFFLHGDGIHRLWWDDIEVHRRWKGTGDGIPGGGTMAVMHGPYGCCCFCWVQKHRDRNWEMWYNLMSMVGNYHFR